MSMDGDSSIVTTNLYTPGNLRSPANKNFNSVKDVESSRVYNAGLNNGLNDGESPK